MLKLYLDAPVNDPDVFYIEESFNIVKEPSWFNDLAIKLIEEIDGNHYIGDGVSESKQFGIISPGELSGGVKTLIYAMNNPNSICPLEWLGQNLSYMLVVVSKTYDVSFAYPGSYFKFDDQQEIYFPEYDETVRGYQGFLSILEKYNRYETITSGFTVNF